MLTIPEVMDKTNTMISMLHTNTVYHRMVLEQTKFKVGAQEFVSEQKHRECIEK